jgi:hypothetical protein
MHFVDEDLHDVLGRAALVSLKNLRDFAGDDIVSLVAVVRRSFRRSGRTQQRRQ